MTQLTRLLNKTLPTGRLHGEFAAFDHNPSVSVIKTYNTRPESIKKVLEAVNKTLTKTYGENYLIITRANYRIYTWTNPQEEYEVRLEQLTILMSQLLELKKPVLAKMQELVDISHHMAELKPQLDPTAISLLKTLSKE